MVSYSDSYDAIFGQLCCHIQTIMLPYSDKYDVIFG